MIKIPNENKQFIVTNRSDLSGNIWYTKNINFDEEGYVRQSDRMIAFISDNSTDASYDADFGLTASFGRYGSNNNWLLGTITNPFTALFNTNSFGSTQDAGSGVPSTSVGTRGTWWQNRWYVTTDSNLFYKVTSGAWTNLAKSFTASIPHPVEVFRNKNSLCVGDGNIVHLYNTSHTETATLTLPADYQVISIKYSNNKVGITTRLSTDSLNQNQDAYFFTWDGASSSASAGFPIGSTQTYGLVQYKGTWVILSKTGQLLYFNGGGFNELAIFPFVGNEKIWVNFDTIGDTLIADGDKIFINISGVLSPEGVKQQTFLPNYHGGIWCYDPNVGLYHKYSPSISVSSQVTVTNANINTTTNIFTSTAGTLPQTGNPIKYIYNVSAQIGGLTTGTVYYIIRIDSTHFKLATTFENAMAGVAIDITSTGDSNNYFLAINLKDYGQSIATFTGGLATNSYRAITYGQMLSSTRSYNAVGTEVNYAQLSIPEFKHISYVVTPRFISSEIEDNNQKVYIKYKPLKTGDSIIVKYKNEEILGIPTSTPQNGVNCTWTNNTTLTVVGDFSEVLTYLTDTTKECELEIISGSGAGQMSQISSISNNAGTYTIVLSDEIEGVTASDKCNILIDNWKNLYTIESGDTNCYSEIPIALTSKFGQLKIIMKGVGITIEELQVINKIHKPSV